MNLYHLIDATRVSKRLKFAVLSSTENYGAVEVSLSDYPSKKFHFQLHKKHGSLVYRCTKIYDRSYRDIYEGVKVHDIVIDLAAKCPNGRADKPTLRKKPNATVKH